MPASSLRVLVLPLKRIYFEQIRDGQKHEEYRLLTPYWAKRLVDRDYDVVELTLGYPSAADEERRLRREWRGFSIKRLTHPHFGPDEVEVYAIDVASAWRQSEGTVPGDEGTQLSLAWSRTCSPSNE